MIEPLPRGILPIGFTIEMTGQRFELVGFGLSDAGKKFFIWKSHCYDCGEAFRTTTMMKFKGARRRCDRHKAPGRPVTGQFRKKGYKRPAEPAEAV